ncbi:hypothetical protein ABI_08590 [Asticcacaulis biprosthecium C19]|uniref:DUF2635 domain-containing protein n=1 Tax=Asticcacaulis biprosthecium C19 TaxID=715226 RepID=F4QG95_9CAUL|nr:DUF2635 domain-containing protein [Asticcacaulis biprosthecium]EGF92423.1 hypothetical protein ABI_08590 [Asticcacaulis biprosthecium C19]
MARLFYRPAAVDAKSKDLRVVPDPATGQALPATGGWVDDSPYWARRRADEDVIDDTAAQTKREADEAKATAKPDKDKV